MAKSPVTIVLAISHAFATVLLGYVLLGFLPMALFASGFVGGLLIWLIVSDRATYQDVRIPYLISLGLFILHKLEEREMDFFPALSQITGVPVPEEGSPLAILLYVLAAAWLLVPLLMTLRISFGYYLAWTFFISMGVVELAHFVLPLFLPGSYGYFPGMASVFGLAPVAWWGLYRMVVPR